MLIKYTFGVPNCVTDIFFSSVQSKMLAGIVSELYLSIVRLMSLVTDGTKHIIYILDRGSVWSLF